MRGRMGGRPNVAGAATSTQIGTTSHAPEAVTATLPIRPREWINPIVDRRHEKRSTVVTTNLSFKQWGTVFPGAACVVALVDRFAQHCNVVDIDADSWRQKNALAREGRDGATDGTPTARGRRRPESRPERQPEVEF
jgi:hypothetical protein